MQQQQQQQQQKKENRRITASSASPGVEQSCLVVNGDTLKESSAVERSANRLPDDTA
jgi:transcription initiation factor TFIID subunit TAF12